MHLHRFATIDASAPSTGSTRIVSVDLLRGLVMMLMALDHTLDYFSGCRLQLNRRLNHFRARFLKFQPMDRPPVHELSAVNGHSLRFKYRSTGRHPKFSPSGKDLPANFGL